MVTRDWIQKIICNCDDVPMLVQSWLILCWKIDLQVHWLKLNLELAIGIWLVFAFYRKISKHTALSASMAKSCLIPKRMASLSSLPTSNKLRLVIKATAKTNWSRTYFTKLKAKVWHFSKICTKKKPKQSYFSLCKQNSIIKFLSCKRSNLS